MRLIVDRGVHPHLAMALDEALAPEPPALRLYGFSPPALTLGYFQRAADFPADAPPRSQRVLVRRLTGGAAIDHAFDLTFSVVATPEFPWFRCDVRESYARVHAVIARGLALLGVGAGPRGPAAARSDSGRADDPVCFRRATDFDLVAGGRKLVGSAQRRTPGRVLHHGSIPLARNPLAPGAACLADVLGREPPFYEVAAALAAAAAEALGEALVPARPDAAEEERAERLVRERYSRDEWNLRR